MLYMAEGVSASKLGNAKKNFGRFFREVKNELKKVIWPSKVQLTNNTMTVLLACFIIGAIIWIFDTGLSKLTEIIFIK